MFTGGCGERLHRTVSGKAGRYQKGNEPRLVLAAPRCEISNQFLKDMVVIKKIFT